MDKKNKNIVFLLLCWFFVPFTISAQDTNFKSCESLIREGVQERVNKNYARSLDILLNAKELATENKWDNLSFLAINNIGIIYSELLEYGDALEAFFEAYNIAFSKSDTRNEWSALINIAIMYSKDGKSENAEKYFKMVFESSKAKNDHYMMGVSAINLAVLHNQINETELSDYYLEIAEPLIQNDNQARLHAQVTRINNHYQKGNIKESKRLSYQLLPETQGVENKEHKVAILLLLSKIYEMEKQPQSVIKYAQEALSENPDIKIKMELYDQFSKAHVQELDCERAILYKDSVIYAKDSLNKVTNSLLFEKNNVKFELSRYQRDAEYKKEQTAKERILFGLLLLLAIILIWAIYVNAQKQKQQKIIAEWNQKIIALELEKEKDNKLLLEKQLREQEAVSLFKQERFNNEQEVLKNKIESKNRELITKAMYFSNKNDLINDIYKSMSLLPEFPKKEELLSHIRQLKEQLRFDSEKNKFLSYFEEVNPEFVNALKSAHPDLSSNDFRFLSYVYMGLNAKEISSLLNITTDSCKKKKMRISQKLKIEEGSSYLFSYLMNLTLKKTQSE